MDGMTTLGMKRFNKKEGLDLQEDIDYPFLRSLVEQESIASIDYFFAQRMVARLSPAANLPIAALLAYLLAVSRLGHLCLKIDGETIEPSLICLSLKKEDEASLKQLLIEGAAQIKGGGIENLIQDVEENRVLFVSTKPIYRDENRFYLQKNWIFETGVVYHLSRLTLGPLETSYSSTEGNTRKEEDVAHLDGLNKDQKEAIETVFQSKIGIITGGPGTGKTYTAACIVKVFLKKFKGELDRVPRIILAAPTGKAVKELEKKMRDYALSFDSILCTTLHALLKIHPHSDSIEEREKLRADLIIIDECSMIDARLFYYLLASLHEKTKVILLGDPDQLPPVGSGGFFADIIEASKNGYPISLSCLKQCMRSDRNEILTLASAINLGKIDRMDQILKKDTEGVKRIDLGFQEKNSLLMNSRFTCYLQKHLSYLIIPGGKEANLIEFFGRFQILSCLRKGQFGVESINRAISEYFMEQLRYGDKLAIPILITKTDANLGLYNGDMGFLIQDNKRSKNQETRALFPSKDNSQELFSIDASLLPNFEYGYCISVHKSQGSEYDHVLLLIPSGAEVFGKEILYTAVTRTKSCIEIEASDEVLQMTIERNSHKISNLSKRLHPSSN